MKRRWIAGLLALALAAALAGCGGSGTQYKDVPVEDLAAAVIAAVGKSDSLAASDREFRMRTEISEEDLGEHAVYITVVGNSTDQFGIFKAGRLKADALKTAAETYIEKMASDNLNNSYFPEESAKFNTAQVKTAGNYVMFCVMSDADMDAAFQAFERALEPEQAS